MSDTITLIDDERHHELTGLVARGRVLIDPPALAEATGWELKPEGFCRDDVCVPVPGRAAVVSEGRIDVAGFAAALGREAVVDATRSIAAIGASAASLAVQMRGLRAPEFTLPDLDGKLVSLSDLGRRKRLLLAWSSW